MTKKEQKIYNWLSEHKGYLKKKWDIAYELAPNDISSVGTYKIFEKIFYKVREDNPGYGSHKVVKKSFAEMFPFSKDFKKRDVLIEKLNIRTKKDKVINLPIEDNVRNKPGTYYVTGCAHAPWQNKAMYESVFNFLDKEIELQGLILDGDIADMNSLSSHDKGKVALKGITLDSEYKEINKFLDEFDDLNVKGTKDYIFGNHEDRYNRAMKDVDTAKFGESLVSPTIGLNLLKRGYRVYDNWKSDCIMLGKHLEINHGEFLNVHTAKKTIDTYRKSVLYFHTHRFQVFVEGLVGGWNMGSGADFNASIFNYATRAMKTSWVNASCIVTIDQQGFYHVQPLVWINNQLIVNGKKY